MTEKSYKFLSLSTVRPSITRPTSSQVKRASALPSSTLHEAAGKRGALSGRIKAVHSSFRVCGPVVTVQSPPADNLWLHRAILVAQPGDVLLAHVSGHYDSGYWGEIMSKAAAVRQLGGLVIDGCVRDSALLEEMGLPVFSRGLCIRGTGKDFGACGWINAPILFDDVVVHPGDLVVGDEDGVVVLPHAEIDSILDKAEEREAEEAQILDRLVNAETTLDIYGWDR